MKTIQAEITSITPRPSKYGGTLYLVTFRADEGSFITWISDQMRNYAKWREILADGKNKIVGNLMVKKDNLINADSEPKIIK